MTSPAVTSQSPHDRPPATRLSRRRLVPLGLLSAGVGLLAAFQPWASGTAADVVLGRVVVTGSGQQLASGVVGAALVAAAGMVAAAITGRLLRMVSAAATLLGGLLGIATSLSVAQDPAGALRTVAGTAVTRTDTVITDAAITWWPWVAALAALVTGLVGVLALITGSGWGEPGRRYEAPGTTRLGSGNDATAHAWDQLSEGEDPTCDPQP